MKMELRVRNIFEKNAIQLHYETLDKQVYMEGCNEDIIRSKEVCDYLKDLIGKSFGPVVQVDLSFAGGFLSKGIAVFPEVLRPDITPSVQLARFLAANPNIYASKTVIDMGCGSGIQGLLMLQMGAKKMIFTDISIDAISNTQENLKLCNELDNMKVIHGDLFENLNELVDLIVFNHPFFPLNPLPYLPVTYAFSDSGSLIHRFLLEARNYLSPKGKILMPYLTIAGETNNPIVQGKRNGYNVEILMKQHVTLGKLSSEFFVCSLTP